MGNVSEKDLVKFNRWTEARRICYYRIEDARNEQVPSIYEYRGLALRKSPMARYLQGLFGILFCLGCLITMDGTGSVIVDSFVRESAASMLVLLFGYRMAQMARDNETGIFDRRYRRKVFYPLLFSRGTPLVVAYFAYYALAVKLGKTTVSIQSLCMQFFTSPFSRVAIIGMIFCQFLFVFPFLWRTLYSRDKRKVNRRMWKMVAVYIGYEVLAGVGVVPSFVHHFFFGRYLLSFSLGMLLFIRRRRGLHLWEILVPGAIGVIIPAGGYVMSVLSKPFTVWMEGFRDLPFSSGAGTLLAFSVVTPLLTTFRYFRLVKPTHAVMAIPGKAYYNIVMVMAIFVGLDVRRFLVNTPLKPNALFLIVFAVLIGICWHLVTRSKWWRGLVGAFFNVERGAIRSIYWMKQKLIVSWCKIRIRCYNRKLRGGEPQGGDF